MIISSEISKTITFSKEYYDFISDHVPENGEAVVPFVCVGDSLLNVFDKPVGIKELSLKSGIQWPFNGDLIWSVSDGKATLIDSNKKVYYMAEVFEECEAITKTKIETGEYVKPDYSLLFHGPKLQSIKTYRQISENMYQVDLLSSKDLAWSFTNWKVDPALADGILQFACMICNQKMGKPSLPVKIGKVCYFKNEIGKNNWCQLEFVRINKLGYVFNGYCFNENNEPLFYVENVNAFFRLGATTDTIR